MIFSSPAYILFLALMLGLLAVVRRPGMQKALLLGASYFFYAYWDWRFLGLMIGMSVINYAVGSRLAAEDGQSRRRRWLWASVVFNLTTLCVFKYFNFFIDSVNAAFGTVVPLVSIVLPIGISFITFEVMSYVIDIYRRTSPPAKSLWDFSLLVAFFPHLIAGPILKPSHFLPQLDQPIRIRWANIEPGLQIFVLGLVKKLAIADNMAAFADPVFSRPELYDASSVWLAVLAYALQIYCDFSGYSDMAIGSAKMLGFEIPRNFDLPYLSTSITEFWRKWHISLSTWLKEYLYISLGGNRHGKLRQHVNLFLTMLLGGLWHGASWNFVFWGALHGVALAIHKMFTELTAQHRFFTSAWAAPFNWALTFGFVCFAWIFFRSQDFDTSWYLICKMLALVPTEGIVWHATPMAWVVPAMVVFHLAARRFGEYRPLPLLTFRGAFAFSFLLLATLFLSPNASSPFIYFQF